MRLHGLVSYNLLVILTGRFFYALFWSIAALGKRLSRGASGSIVSYGTCS